MNADFPRILTLLRKEKGISQKQAAANLSVSQALLSHYEKGIRECGLDFLVKCARFYGVSSDYLLGISPDRHGTTITLDDIPDPEDTGKENRSMNTVLPILNKKLIFNSLNILFDLLVKAGNKALTTEVSAFLMLAVYRVFRVAHSMNPGSQAEMFNVPFHVCSQYVNAAMQISEANASAIAAAPPRGAGSSGSMEGIKLSPQVLEEKYPRFSSSLFNLIQNSENRISYLTYAERVKR